MPAGDNFVCGNCNWRRVDIRVHNIDRDAQHRYTHDLLRCKSHDHTTEGGEVDERMVKLENKVSELDGKVNALNSKISRLEDYLVRMESTLALLLPSSGGSGTIF